MDNETLIFICYLIINILSACCISLLDSRIYWRKQWEKDEDYIFFHMKGDNNEQC